MWKQQSLQKFEGRKFKVYYSDASGHLKSTLNKIAMKDGAAFFLVGATALTDCLKPPFMNSWKNIDAIIVDVNYPDAIISSTVPMDVQITTQNVRSSWARSTSQNLPAELGLYIFLKLGGWMRFPLLFQFYYKRSASSTWFSSYKIAPFWYYYLVALF